MAERDDDEKLPPPPPNRGRDREMWVGIFLIVGILATLGVLFTLTDAAMFRGRYVVTTIVKNAGGIRKGDPVRMRGVPIGRVQRFKIAQNDVAVRLEVEGEYSIPVDSKVELKQSSLLGEMMADVVPGSSSQMAEDGTVLAGEAEGGAFAEAGNLAARADEVLANVQKAVSEETVANLSKSAADARALFAEMNAMVSEQRKELAALSKSLRRSAEAMEKAMSGPELENAVKKTETIANRLDEASQSFSRSSKSLESVLARVEKGEGTLGRLTKDDALYDNLNQASQELKLLAEDLRKNPKRYVKLSLF